MSSYIFDLKIADIYNEFHLNTTQYTSISAMKEPF